MKILFTNPSPMIKYGMQPGFEKHGWITDRLELINHSVDALEKKIKAFNPDFLFTEGGVDTKSFIFPVLDNLKTPHIYWAVEDPVANNTLAMEWAKRSVLTLTPATECVENYQKNNYKAICIPFAIDPDYYHGYPVDPHFSTLDAIHIGNNYNVFSERLNAYGYILQPFIDQKKAFEVYGFDWRHPKHAFHLPDEYDKGYLSHEQSVIAYSNVKINLGVHSITKSRTMQSMRTFEILGCGGFFLTQKTVAIDCMFQNHVHLVSSSSYEETIELMNFYLSHPDERKKIAENGQRFVYSNHTYAQRVEEIIRSL